MHRTFLASLTSEYFSSIGLNPECSSSPVQHRTNDGNGSSDKITSSQAEPRPERSWTSDLRHSMIERVMDMALQFTPLNGAWPLRFYDVLSNVK